MKIYKPTTPAPSGASNQPTNKDNKMNFIMENWQIEMVKEITPKSKNYNNTKAIQLANEWENTDEKLMMIMDYFSMSANDKRFEYWVDRIETQFEKILESNKTSLNKNAESWLWLCEQ